MKKVLIVDDAAFMRKTLKIILEKNDYEIVGEAENGKAALLKLAALTPDIITLDITMPEMDGLECLIEMKKLNIKSDIVMISAMGQQSFVVDAVKNGAKGFIVKPFKEDDVIKQFEKLS